MMKAGILVLIVITVWVSWAVAEPSFNGNNPGCSGSGCHSFHANDINYSLSGSLDVEVTLTGVQSGRKVAGELVDMNGTVVDVINSTSSNPLTLTAPAPGKYLINAGYKNPSRRWDSLTVDISLTSIDPSHDLNSVNSYELFQNYPNPFNPSTLIRYSVPKTSDVKIEIFDLFGRNISTLVNVRKSAGEYSINFDGTNLASGVYLYKLETGNYFEVKKMVLMK
jgi:hypothetical protein